MSWWMTTIQPLDTDEVQGEENHSYDEYGYGECVTNTHESDML